jgi:hypothetical protein
MVCPPLAEVGVEPTLLQALEALAGVVVVILSTPLAVLV